MNNNIVIAGCGYIGQALAEALISLGHNVYGIKRSKQQFPFKLQLIQADLTTMDKSDLPSDIDYAFFMPAPNRDYGDDYETTYLLSLKHFCQQLPDNIKRLFFISSTSVYGQKNGEWVDENSVTCPLSESGKIILQAEQYLATQTIPYTIARFAGIYGPERIRVIDQILKRKLSLTDTSIYTNRIHRDDCVQSLLHLMQLTDIGKIYNVTDSEPIEKNVFISWLAEHLDVELSDQYQATSTIASSTRANKRCSNKLLLASGYQLIYPDYREGYKKLINERAYGTHY